ncbi:MAG TPA: SHOCT domain-containing protein [Armatimonadaceae bacterium]|nr:SHOCT domain-containing protein [Armatimonadaceae bacterium]
MGVADELERLASLHREGTLTDEEFARAKQAVISGGSPSGTAAAGAGVIAGTHLEALRHQNELERLDREWDRERERYMVRGKYGTRYVPSRGMAIGMGVVSGVFGIFWMLLATDITRNGLRSTTGGGGMGGAFLVFPLFGALFILAALFMAVDTYRKAVAYGDAEADYRRRRALLLARQGR